MLTTLSILSRDQGPKWQEPKADENARPEVAPGPLDDVFRAVARIAALSRWAAPSRSRA